MKANHTPGPWIKKCGFLVGADGSDIVASGLGLGLGADCGDGVRKANASLIAAAPELLEALKNLDEAYCRSGGPLTRAERNEDRKRLIAARAAIAKATGEQE